MAGGIGVGNKLLLALSKPSNNVKPQGGDVMVDEEIKDCDGKSIGTRFSDLWTIKLGDWERGFIVAVLTAPLTIIYDTVTATPMSLTFNWKQIIGVAIAAAVAYILKNLGTGAGGRYLTNAPPSK